MAEREATAGGALALRSRLNKRINILTLAGAGPLSAA